MEKKLFSNKDKKNIKDILAALDMDDDNYYNNLDSEKVSSVLDVKESAAESTAPEEMLRTADHNFLTAEEAYKEIYWTIENEDYEHCLETASYHYQKAIEIYESLLDKPEYLNEQALTNLVNSCLQIRANNKAEKYQQILLNLQIDNYKQIIKEKITDFYTEHQISTREKLIETMRSQSLEAKEIYTLIREYIKRLYTAKDEARALDAYDFLSRVSPEDKLNQINLAVYYLNQQQYDKSEAILLNLKITIDENKYRYEKIIDTVYTQLWRLYRKSGQFDKCITLLKEADQKDYLKFILEHLNAGLDIDEFEHNSFSTLLSEVKNNIDLLFNENNPVNELIPNSHLNKLREIQIIDGVCPEGISTLGMIHFNPYNNDIEKRIESFEKGLAEFEQFQVRLHEIGHNVAINLKRAPDALYRKGYSYWLGIVKEFGLESLYAGEMDPANEAFADYYASFIMFPKLWKKHKDLSDKNRRIYKYFKWLFMIDSYEEADVKTIIQNISAQEFRTMNAHNNINNVDLIMVELEEERKGHLRKKRLL